MTYLEESDVEFEAARSGGPGGQHGDRRATAVRLRVPFEDIPLNDEERKFFEENLPPKNRTKDDEMLVEIGGSRSQRQNRKKALEVANEEIEKALEAGRQARRKKNYKQRVQRRSAGGGSGGGGEEDLHEKRKKRRRSETTDDLLEQAYEQAPDLFSDSASGKDPDPENQAEDE